MAAPSGMENRIAGTEMTPMSTPMARWLRPNRFVSLFSIHRIVGLSSPNNTMPAEGGTYVMRDIPVVASGEGVLEPRHGPPQGNLLGPQHNVVMVAHQAPHKNRQSVEIANLAESLGEFGSFKASL